MAMEPHKLRFVRCPKCLQLLVEYPSIPVYQCGCCGTVLRAKNRGAVVAHSNLESGEDNNVPCSLDGSPLNGKSICSDEHKSLSSNEQPSENVVERDISSVSMDAKSCENVNPERTNTIAVSATPGEIDNEKKCYVIDGNVGSPESMIKETDDEGTEAYSSPKIVKNGETSETVNVEKGSSMDDANDGSIVSEIAAAHSMEGKELGADSSNNIREVENVIDQKYSSSNKSLSCPQIAESNTLHEEDGAKSNGMLIQRERSQPYGSLRIESYEDLIEELERSLSLSDDEEDYLDVADNNGLNDALHHQIGSQRFSSGGKINDATRTDPHGRLIEELERSFSDAEGHLEHHGEVAEKDIPEKIHGKDPLFLVDGSANPYEGSIPSSDAGRIKSGQDFQQNELAVDETNEKAKSHMDDNMNDSVNENEPIMITNKDIAEKIYRNGHDKATPYLVTQSANPCEGSISSSNNLDLKSGLSFRQNDLVADDTKEKKENCMEDSSSINCVHVNEHDMNMQYLGTKSVHACEEDISFFNDDHLKSRQSFQQHKLIADGTEEKKETCTEKENMTICVQADNVAPVAGFSSLSNERIHCKSPSFTKKKEEISCRYRASLLRQGLSLDSEDFKSIQNFIESQMDGTLSSQSSGSPSQGDLVLKTSNKFTTVDQLERLKKMDDLRDQLNRLSSQKGLERRYQKKDTEYQLQLNSYDAEQHQSVDADSVPSSCTLDSYYGHGKPPRYPLPNSFSPPHSCAHCYFGHVQPHIPHNYDAWEFKSYYQSSQAGSSILDHDSFKSTFKEQKRVVRKHILRPLSGASPYTVCNSCFNLVQVPSDIYMSKKKIGKMQCGQCSKVIMLSCPAVNHAHASIISKEAAPKASKPADRTDSKTADASYPVSFSESYVASSFTRSFRTHAGSSLAATQSSKKVSESALHRLMGYDSASQLLRYSRVFERHSRVFDDGYESFESMVPVSNRVSRRKNM